MHVSCIYVRAWWDREGEKLKTLWFLHNFEGVKGAMGNLAPAAVERAEPLLCYFGDTFGSLWVSSGDFGSLNDYFGIIVELLWV